jgi:hypothetical protein
MGIQTAAIRKETFSDEIIAPAWVEEMESAVRTITAPDSGRVVRLLVDIPGEPIQKDQAVAIIETPELGNVTVRSEWEGILRTKNVSEGRSLGRGEVLFALTDLSKVWVKASVFESEMGRISPGTRVKITSEAVPGTTLEGTMKFIEARADLQTRAMPVRIEVSNPGMRLRPGMFVRAAFQIMIGTTILTVPRGAVIDRGIVKVVYVELPDGVFQQRSVEVGDPGKQGYPVFSGLAEGERVAVNGAFLIDSQMQLSGDTGAYNGYAPVGSPPSSEKPAEEYQIQVSTSPRAPTAGAETQFRATVLDSAGHTLGDAQVRLTLMMPAMPAMGMPEMRTHVDLRAGGTEYTGSTRLSMAGSWNLIAEARRGNQILATTRLNLNVR